ncbi:unnamed protein product [Rhizophagus irregularis]|uniref:Uncharacterized protein n=1 Tax=Rhizophagus irregularis TaxID=588596 RepID=A0A915ZYH0_9GLOM|nr:unnamed protein product [Rhizophagus irregularis]
MDDDVEGLRVLAVNDVEGLTATEVMDDDVEGLHVLAVNDVEGLRVLAVEEGLWKLNAVEGPIVLGDHYYCS